MKTREVKNVTVTEITAGKRQFFLLVVPGVSPWWTLLEQQERALQSGPRSFRRQVDVEVVISGPEASITPDGALYAAWIDPDTGEDTRKKGK